MYLSNFILSRYYNIKSSLSTEIAQNGEFCPNSAQPTASRARAALCRAGAEMPPKEGLTLWLRIKALAKKGQRGAPNWLQTIYYGRNNKVN